MSNAANGKSFTHTMTSTDKLCLADAEWIEEDLVVDDAEGEGLANFGSVTFTNAVATTKTGTMNPGDNPIYMVSGQSFEVWYLMCIILTQCCCRMSRTTLATSSPPPLPLATPSPSSTCKRCRWVRCLGLMPVREIGLSL